MKLTSAVLRKMVKEEAAKKFGKPVETAQQANKTEEVDADEYAGSLEKKIDYVKALKIEEQRLTKRLKAIKERLHRMARSLVENV